MVVIVWIVSEPPSRKILLPSMMVFPPVLSLGRLGRGSHFYSENEYFWHSLMISPDSFLPPKM